MMSPATPTSYTFPNLTSLRRDFADSFSRGNPGVMWVIGGWSGADTPPFGPPEYFEVPLMQNLDAGPSR